MELRSGGLQRVTGALLVEGRIAVVFMVQEAADSCDHASEALGLGVAHGFFVLGANALGSGHVNRVK